MPTNDPDHPAKRPSPRKQGDLTSAARAMKAGRSSFDALQDRLYPFLVNAIRKQGRLPAGYEIDDLVQLTVLRIWQSFDQFRDEDGTSMSAWAKTIAVNLCAEIGRKKSNNLVRQQPKTGDETTPVDPAADTVGPATRANRRDVALRIEGCLHELSEAERKVFQRHVIDDIQLKDVAAELGMPDATVRSHFRRGREKVAAAVARLGIDESS